MVPRDAVFDERASRGPGAKEQAARLATEHACGWEERHSIDQTVQFDRIGANSFAGVPAPEDFLRAQMRLWPGQITGRWVSA